MPDDREQGLQAGDNSAFGAAHMVAIEHELQIGFAHVPNDVFRLLRRSQEITWRIVPVQRFDQYGSALRLRYPTSVTKILDEGVACVTSVRETGHDMNVLRADLRGIADGFVDRGPRLNLSSGNSCQPVVPVGHVAAPRVQSQHGKAGLFQRLFDLGRSGIVWPMAFDGIKPCCFRRMNRVRQ